MSVIVEFSNTYGSEPFSLNTEGCSSEEPVTGVAERALENNGDFVLTPVREGVYIGVDGLGTGRQIIEAICCVVGLFFNGCTAVANALQLVNPLAMFTTGPAVMASGIAWTIPDACDELIAAQRELAGLEEEAKHGINVDLNRVEDAKRAVEIAKLGLANMYLYTNMGVGQIAVGAVTLLTPEVAKVLHYTPVLTGASATAAVATVNIFLGGIYAIRGSVMFYRTFKSYQPVREMRKTFDEALAQETAFGTAFETAFETLKTEEEKGDAYFARRVDPSCLEYEGEEGIGKYTALGTVSSGNLTPYKTDADKMEYLRRVDKGIYTKKLKHVVAFIIAGAMIIGGITAIALAIFTGGIAPLVIGLISAIGFTIMESVFLTYDSSFVFKKIRDLTYAPHRRLQSEHTNNGYQPILG